MTYFIQNGQRVVGDVHTLSTVVPFGNLFLWSNEELAAIGITKMQEPIVAPVIDDAVVRAECKQRIYAVASEATQANLTAYMVILNQKVGAGQALTAQEQADVNLFQQAMAWISAMRSTVLTLIGDPNYNLDEKWPALSDELKAFAARF